MSRARHELTGAPLAPKNATHVGRVAEEEDTMEQACTIPQAVLDFMPESTLQLDKQLIVKCLQTAPSGCAPGPGGCTNEMLRVCLDDDETLQLFMSAAEDFARGNGSRRGEEVIHVGHDDRSAEKGRWGSGASPQEVLSGDWWLRHLPNSSGKQWRPRVPLSNSHFPLARRHGLCGTRSPNSN